MKDIEKKALALVNEVQAEYPLLGAEVSAKMALCRAIEQHEAFRQEVSDAVSGFFADDGFDRTGLLRRFIIADPDPLVEVLADMGLKPKGGYDWASEFRNTLAQRGGKIVWEEE